MPAVGVWARQGRSRASDDQLSVGAEVPNGCQPERESTGRMGTVAELRPAVTASREPCPNYPYAFAFLYDRETGYASPYADPPW